MKGNVIVGQSGGPTAAINSSLAGVYPSGLIFFFDRSYSHTTFLLVCYLKIFEL